MRVLIMSATNFEDLELFVPYYCLRAEDVTVDIASMKQGKITGKHGYSIEAGMAFDEVNPDKYDMLLLPGGKAPAAIRKHKAAVNITQAFFEQGKPVASICHGAQLLATADVIEGKRLTSYKSVAPEVKRAGGIWEDREVVVDGKLVTSRQPPDLPAFTREMMRALKKQ